MRELVGTEERRVVFEGTWSFSESQVLMRDAYFKGIHSDSVYSDIRPSGYRTERYWKHLQHREPYISFSGITSTPLPIVIPTFMPFFDFPADQFKSAFYSPQDLVEGAWVSNIDIGWYSVYSETNPCKPPIAHSRTFHSGWEGNEHLFLETLVSEDLRNLIDGCDDSQIYLALNTLIIPYLILTSNRKILLAHYLKSIANEASLSSSFEELTGVVAAKNVLTHATQLSRDFAVYIPGYQWSIRESWSSMPEGVSPVLIIKCLEQSMGSNLSF